MAGDATPLLSKSECATVFSLSNSRKSFTDFHKWKRGGKCAKYNRMKLLCISAFCITLLSCNEGQNQSNPSITDTMNTDIEVADTFGTTTVPDEQVLKVEPAFEDATPKLSCEFIKGKWKATIMSNADAEFFHENIDLECYDGFKLRLKSSLQSLLAFQGEAVGSLNLLKSRNVHNESTELYLERQGDVVAGSLTRNISGDKKRYSVMLERD